MSIDTNWLIDKFKQVFTSVDRKGRITETDEAINEIAPDRIKRSPGHQNLAELTDEPEWFHE